MDIALEVIYWMSNFLKSNYMKILPQTLQNFLSDHALIVAMHGVESHPFEKSTQLVCKVTPNAWILESEIPWQSSFNHELQET